MMSSVRVAVRVRPLNKREKQLSAKVIIHIKGSTTSIHKPSPVRGEKQVDRRKIFSFDYSYDSTDTGSPMFSSQEKIFQDLGSNVLKAAFEGFNACVFAYGQTGSGKSYTMMGYKEDKGLIPRICEGLFLEMSHRSKNEAVSFSTEVSYLEIYNERVQDLLKDRSSSTDGGLKVREHPRDGPFVENLSKHAVENHSDMEGLIFRGDANRTTASTGMNDLSSRSHAIFTIMFTQARFDSDLPRETLSKIHLVDLAGSERADATHATGIRLKEGANINKSLVTLGSVISALADLSVGGQSAKKKQIFIPYRDSVLTWLLKDSLGGNSMTTMVATISPADINYEETLSTLRYASRAKNIMNTPTVNEDGSVKVIRELQEEVTRLKTLLAEAAQVFHGELFTSVNVEEKLRQNEVDVEALIKKCTSRWEETRSVLQEKTVALRKEESGVVLDCPFPHLIGIDKDLLGTGIILYYLKEGKTIIGSDKSSCSQNIVLHGPGLMRKHCMLENHAGTVTLFPQDGALCSVNGSVVTNPCQLTQGTIIQLGKGVILRFNHPAEASLLREKCHEQSGPQSDFCLSLTDSSKSPENPTRAMRKNSGALVKVDNWQEKETDNLTRCSMDNRGISAGNIFAPNQQTKMKTTRLVWRSHIGQMSVMAAEKQSKDGSNRIQSTTAETAVTIAIPGGDPVPHTEFELDGDSLRGGVSTWDGQERERDLCHKSGPGLMSERPQRKAQRGAGVASFKGDKVWSGDASLQQTSVLGPGDGCGTKPEGNANEIQGVTTDCYKERPGSGGSSLGSMSHLQRSEESSFRSVLLQTSTHSQLDIEPIKNQAACGPPKDAAFESQFSCEEMEESGGLAEIPEVCVTQTAAATAQNSGLGSFLTRVSWIFQDARRLLWSYPTVMQQVTIVRLQHIGACWSSNAVSLIRESNALSVLNNNQVSSMVSASFIFSLLRESHILSRVQELPFIHYTYMNIAQHLLPKEAAQVIQGWINTDSTPHPVPTPTQAIEEELSGNVQHIIEDIQRKDLSSIQKQDEANIHIKQRDENVIEPLLLKDVSKIEVTRASEDGHQISGNSDTMHIAKQTLIEFPDPLLKLQSLPAQDAVEALQSLISTTVNSQKILSLHWLNVAKCSQPGPQPALLILMETGLYTLTTESGLLVLFHQLPLLQLTEIHIGLAGHSLRLMGITEESILGVYTHSEKHTKELCQAILGAVCAGKNKIAHHPLIHGDLMRMSLDCRAYVPDLVLDSGLRVCCRFQKNLADLVYFLHCNTDQEQVTLGEVQLLMYTSVAVQVSRSTHSEHLAQFFLTDAHLGLVRWDAVFHPPPRLAPVAACRPQFYDLFVRQRSKVRCMLLHNEDKSGSVRLDVIFANVKDGGHPENVTKEATPSEHALNSSPHAELWKLTFSCSIEAACLINHLSKV